MPGVVTLELAATPAAQRGHVETQTPPGDLKTLPSVHREEELEPEEILMSPADVSLAADTIHGWQEDVGVGRVVTGPHQGPRSCTYLIIERWSCQLMCSISHWRKIFLYK